MMIDKNTQNEVTNANVSVIRERKYRRVRTDVNRIMLRDRADRLFMRRPDISILRVVLRDLVRRMKLEPSSAAYNKLLAARNTVARAITIQVDR